MLVNIRSSQCNVLKKIFDFLKPVHQLHQLSYTVFNVLFSTLYTLLASVPELLFLMGKAHIWSLRRRIMTI